MLEDEVGSRRNGAEEFCTKVNTIQIYDNNQNVDNANVQVIQGRAESRSDPGWPHTDMFHDRMYLPEIWAPSGNDVPILSAKYASAIVHEFGHDVFQLWDEYLYYVIFPFWTEIPYEYRVDGVMSGRNDFPPEFSTSWDYADALQRIQNENANLIYICTGQMQLSGVTCWNRIFNDWNYYNGYLVTNNIENFGPFGVQFDLDGDSRIDTEYLANYKATEFGFAEPYYYEEGNFWPLKYQGIGDLATVIDFTN